MLREAARHGLMVSAHGGLLPRGWDRTFPHLIAVAAVRGSSGYRTDPVYPAYAPTQNTILAFTRNAVGPMDYAPVVFSTPPQRRRTTWGHEIGLAVVFESGLQRFPDAAGYMAAPEDARAFLRDVPAAWDETRLLDGAPGSFVVMARRAGRSWFIGGINGEATSRPLAIPLDLLGSGTFEMLLVADGRTGGSFLVTKRQRNGLDTQAVLMLPYGGFAMRLTPLH
jgi:hypothetical protein